MFYNTFMKKLLPVLFTLLFSVALAQLEPRGQLQGMFEVARVVDGDTVRVVINGQEEAIRLIGIDTPETVHPTRGEEPFGREASDFTKGLLERLRKFGYYWAALLLLGAVVLVVLPMMVSSIEIEF